MEVTERRKKQLIVIGNGMAGARTLEEILARGGGEQFAITVCAEEPYGNYNRILLSSVLNGSQDPSAIFLNGLDWYAEHGVTSVTGSLASLKLPPSTSAITYTPTNQIASWGGTPASVDAASNLLADPTFGANLVWDERNLMASGGSFSLQYDAKGAARE